MTDLIAKLEAAEPSRELDRDVAMSRETAECDPFKEYPGMYYLNTPVEVPNHPEFLKRRAARTSPHYTTSIDAKLPWENITEMAWHDLVEGEPMGEICEAWHRDKKTGERTMGAHRTSEAMARRIAALKAKP